MTRDAGVSQAVILVGGQGTRMRPLTDTLPKPMLSLMGLPFVDLTSGFVRLLRSVEIQGFAWDWQTGDFGRVAKSKPRRAGPGQLVL